MTFYAFYLQITVPDNSLHILQVVVSGRGASSRGGRGGQGSLGGWCCLGGLYGRGCLGGRCGQGGQGGQGDQSQPDCKNTAYFEDVPIKCKSGASAEYALVLGAIDFYWSPGMS